MNTEELRREPGYIAFREDYRWRWNEPDAEPLHGWAAYFDKARWARIENASKAALEAENAALKADAERWRWWRKRWAALCRMEVAASVGLDLSQIHVTNAGEMDAVTDEARSKT